MGIKTNLQRSKPKNSGVLCCNYPEERRQFSWNEEGHLGHFPVSGRRNMATMVKGAHGKVVGMTLTGTLFLTLSVVLFNQHLGTSLRTPCWKDTFMVKANTPQKVSSI